jgi:hypothetical protein
MLFGGLLLVPCASAGQVTNTFNGTVTGPGPGITLPPNVAVGESISGYFTYTTMPTSGTGVYNFAGTGQSFIFSIPILNNTSTFSDQNSNVSPNNIYKITITDTGTKGATFDVFASMIDSSGKTGITCDILFTSSTYTGLALPSSTAAFTAAFANTKASFNWDPGDLGIGADITIINGQSVPEPPSLVLAVVAMSTCIAGSVIISRRKSARALQGTCTGQAAQS